MKEKSKDMCRGCYEDDYNHGFMGSKECWSYDSAKVMDRIAIPVEKAPPYDLESATPMLSCYNKKRWVFVKPEALRHDGYWK